VAAWLWLLAATRHSAPVGLPLDQIGFHSAVSHGGPGGPQEAHVEATLGADGGRVHLAFEPDQVPVSPDTTPVARTTCQVSLP